LKPDCVPSFVSDYGFAVMTRNSHSKDRLIFHLRVGGGFGYKAPTIFAKKFAKNTVSEGLALEVDNNKLERKLRGNVWIFTFKQVCVIRPSLFIVYTSYSFFTCLKHRLTASADIYVGQLVYNI
jgi:iron complex outermembrane receptor protein